MGFKSSSDIRSLWVFANSGSFTWKDPKTNAVCESDCFEGIIRGVEFEEAFYTANNQKQKTGTNINLHVEDVDPNGFDHPIIIKGALEREGKQQNEITVYGRMLLGRLGNLENHLSPDEVLLLSVWNTTTYKLCCVSVRRSVHPDKSLPSFPLDPKDDPAGYRSGIRQCIKNVLSIYPLVGDLSALKNSAYDFGDIGQYLEAQATAGSLAQELRTREHSPAAGIAQDLRTGRRSATAIDDDPPPPDDHDVPYSQLFGEPRRIDRTIGPDDDGLPF